MLGTRVAVKRLLLGRPRATRELHHQLFPKRMALPVFASDPLSSVAYATQEMMLVLVLAGAGALALVSPISFAIAALLIIVVLSYRQTVRAYPHGGGAYIVARENLGVWPGLVAAAALLIDYALTVAVSMAAGVAAIVSAFPELAEHRLLLALGILAAVTLVNLRGAREAGFVFAFPTYGFIVVMLALIAVGVTRCGIGIGGCPPAPSAGLDLPEAQALTVFLVLRAFASGAAALTGVEAISNGVTAFRYPQSRNAAATLAMLGAVAVVLFLGVSYLARATGVVAHEGMERTVVAEIALAVFGDGAGFLLVQAATAAILVLAANTSYADFPRLAAVLARDRWLPRQFLARGDRLVFSNGILLLGVAAGSLLAVYRASVTELVHLYVVGVFTAFTLSQTGMVRRWLARRGDGWLRSMLLNGVGAVVCAVVLVVVVVTKFVEGAWLVLLAIPLLAAVMRSVHRHYEHVSDRLHVDLAAPPSPRAVHGVILLDRVDEAAARALSYAVSTELASIKALGVPLPGSDLGPRWATLAPDLPLEILQDAKDPGTADRLVEALAAEAERRPGDVTTAIIPETLARTWVDQLREHRLALRLKAKLHHHGGLVVTDIPSPVGGPGPYTVEEPAEHHLVVLVDGVNAAVLRALAYAQGLHASTIRALMVNLDPERSAMILAEWEDWDLAVPLEVLDSPFRSLSATVRAYLRSFAPDGRHTIVTCVVPELVVEKPWQRVLHNQSALLVRSVLLFERGVVTASVPYVLSDSSPSPRAPAEATGDG